MARNTSRAAVASKEDTHVFRDQDTNAVLSDKTQIANAYRKAAAAICEAGEELAPMTEDQIWSLVSAIPGDGPAADAKRIMAVYEYDPEATETDTDDTAKTDSGGRQRVTLQQRIGAYQGSQMFFALGRQLDNVTVGHMDHLANAKEDFDGATLVLVDDFYRLFCKRDQHGNITTNPIVRWPRPGVGTDRNPAINNEPVDYYKVRNPNTDTQIRGSVYVDMFEASAPGQRWSAVNDVLMGIKGEGMTEAEKAILNENVVDAAIRKLLPAIFNSNDGDAIKRVKKWNDNRKASIVRKMRDAVRIIQQKDAIEALPNMHVYFPENDMQLAAKLRNPIKIVVAVPGKLPQGPDPVTVGTFLRYDVKKAKAIAAAAGRDIVPADITQTARRAPKGAGNGKKADNLFPEIAGMKEFAVVMPRLQTFFDKHADTSIIAACNKADGSGDALVMAIGSTFDALDGIMKKIQVRYDQLVDAEANRKEAAANKG